MGTGPEYFGRTVPSDDQAADYCETLEQPLQRDIASMLWWDNIDRQPMSRCFSLACMEIHPGDRDFASRDEVVRALQGIGYTEQRANSRVSNVNYNDNSKRRMAERRKRLKAIEAAKTMDHEEVEL